MNALFEHLDRTPVTYLVLLVYVTMAVLTDPLDPDVAELIEHGACVGLLVQDGEPWRLLSAAFLHGGLMHLLFNGYAMLAVGPALEASLGSLRFALLYFVAALGGSVVATVWNWGLQPLVGGSGALFGMFGAIVALQMRQGRHAFEFLSFRGPRSILALIAVNLLIGWILPFVSNAAHIGGLLAGFGLTFLWFDRGRIRRETRAQRATRFGSVALLCSWTLYCMWPVANDDFAALRSEVRGMREDEWVRTRAELTRLHPSFAEAMANWRQ